MWVLSLIHYVHIWTIGGLAECQYCYTEQPPEELTCNPYINSELRLECRIRVPFRSRPQVVWFYRTENGQQQGECLTEMLQNTETAAGQPKISIPPLQRMGSILEGQTHVRSRLHIRSLNDSDAGMYWCRLITNGSTLLDPSDPVYLQTQAAYVNFSASCPPLSSISKQEEKCADSIRPTPNSSHTCYTSSTPQAITPSQTVRASLQGTRLRETITSSSMIVPSLRPTPVLHNSYISQSTTEMPSMAPVLPTDLEDGAYTSDTVTRATSPTSNKLLPELCIAVAVLVLFGIAIAVLFPIAIYMCLKRPDTKGGKSVSCQITFVFSDTASCGENHHCKACYILKLRKNIALEL